MIHTFRCKYFLPEDDELIVDVTITPGRPMKMPDIHGPGEPEEHAEIEIDLCMFGSKPFHPEGLYVMDASGVYQSLCHDIEESAWEQFKLENS